MYEYTSIYSNSHSEFNKKLNDLSREGWIPEGNASFNYEYNPRSSDFEKFFLLLKRQIKTIES